MIDRDIQSARDTLTVTSGYEEIKQLVELREKAVMDEISRINGAREEGREEERNRSEKKISNMAKKMLELGQTIELVTEVTELPFEKIKEIQKNL